MEIEVDCEMRCVEYLARIRLMVKRGISMNEVDLKMRENNLLFIVFLPLLLLLSSLRLPPPPLFWS